MRYVNTTFNFLGNSLTEKGKSLVFESSYFCVDNYVLLIYCSFSFFFWEDKKLKKLAEALKFPYFFTALRLNSNLFYYCFLLVLYACKDLSSLYNSSKRRNYLQPDNLETLFLLSAIKVTIKSGTNKVEMKYLEEA